jgi:hypothetical protein
MDKLRKLELVQRSLGLRHKLKVHESMPQPSTHEDMALMLLSKWELEDELRAIEEILADHRGQNVSQKRLKLLAVEHAGAEAAADAAEASGRNAASAKKKGASAQRPRA